MEGSVVNKIVLKITQLSENLSTYRNYRKIRLRETQDVV